MRKSRKRKTPALHSDFGSPYRGRHGPVVIERVPAEFAVEQGIIPIQERNGTLILAVDDQLKRIVADQLSFTLGCDVKCALAAPGALKGALSKYYGVEPEQNVAQKMGADEDASEAPIVRLVTRMFKEALEARASDIHLEPMGESIRVRYRIDGVLRPDRKSVV